MKDNPVPEELRSDHLFLLVGTNPLPNWVDRSVLLMTQVGIDDFSIRDLIKPEVLRVKKILSAIINFARFREEQLSVFDKYTERSVHHPIFRFKT